MFKITCSNVASLRGCYKGISWFLKLPLLLSGLWGLYVTRSNAVSGRGGLPIADSFWLRGTQYFQVPMALILPSMVGRSPSSMVLICCASKYGTGTSNYQQRAIPSTVLVCCAPKYCDGVLPSIVGRTSKYGTVRPCFHVLWDPSS